MPIDSLLIDNWGRTHTLPGDYQEFKPQFKLIHRNLAGVETPLIIREPAGWDGCRIKLFRDEEWHGMSYERTDENFTLRFDSFSGREFIETAKIDEGTDAEIRLQFGIVAAGTYYVEYEGKLNLSTYKRVKRKVSLILERATLQQQIKTRWDTDLPLFSRTSLDGVALGQVPIRNIALTSQSINEKFESKGKVGGQADQAFMGDTNGHVWIQFDTSNPTTSEIEEFAGGKSLGITESMGPLVDDLWLFKFRSAGKRTVKITVIYKFWCWIEKRLLNIGKPKITSWTLNTKLVLRKATGEDQTLLVHAPLSNGANPNFKLTDQELEISATGIKTFELDTAAGDRLYLFGIFSFTHTKNEIGTTNIRVTSLQCDIAIDGKTYNSPSLAPGLLLHDAISQSIAQITGLEDRFRSEFYGIQGDRYAVDGCGAPKMITSGIAIRGGAGPLPFYDPKAITLSIRDLLFSAKAWDNIGMEYGKEIGVGGAIIDVIKVAPVEEFYKDVELLSIDDVGNYSEETVKSEIFSKIEFGYDKHPTEGAGILEEFCTKRTATTSIKNEASTFINTSPIIASGLAIELTRREQFADKPKDSTAYDEDGFVIQCKKSAGFSGRISFFQAPYGYKYVVIPSEPIKWLAPGMVVIFSGTASHNNTYVVVTVAPPNAPLFYFELATDALDFTGEIGATATVAPFAGQEYIPELGSDFEQVSGLDDPDTAYNLRLSPGRMLKNSAPVWAGCLAEKPAMDAFNQTTIPQNKKLITRTAPTDDCDPLAGQTFGDGEGMILAELAKPIWLPVRINCETRLSRSAVQRLRAALTGQLAPEIVDGVLTDLNYGYITVKDEGGQPVSGWVMSMQWEPMSEKVILELRKKAVVSGYTSGTCEQFLNTIIEQAENLPFNTIQRLLNCRYIDLDIL